MQKMKKIWKEKLVQYAMVAIQANNKKQQEKKRRLSNKKKNKQKNKTYDVTIN